MSQEEQLEILLLEKDYHELNQKDVALLQALGWSRADYQSERRLRQELNIWAKADHPHQLPAHIEWRSNDRPKHSLLQKPWLLAACWLLSLGIAAFLGSQTTPEKPLAIVEKIVYQTDTFYVPAAATVPQLAAIPSKPPSVKKVPPPPPPVPIQLVNSPDPDRPDVDTLAYSPSRNMAADRELMQLTAKVW